MSRFQPSAAYQPEWDVRLAPGVAPPSWLRPLLEARSPNAECWLVVMPRRAGKTWLSRGLAHARPADATRFVDLRAPDAAVRKASAGCLIGAGQPKLKDGLLLVDEPALGPGGRFPAVLAEGLGRLRTAGAVPVVFATPHEYAALTPHLAADAVKDTLFAPGLDPAEVARMTDREPTWAPTVAAAVRAVDPAWERSPFLLELLLRAADDHPSLRDDVTALLRAAQDEAAGHQYLPQVFDNGLAPAQRAALRSVRWAAAGVPAAPTAEVTLLAKTRVTDDPVVARYLPTALRLHHVSDLHHGGRLAGNVDAKDASQAGRGLAALTGAGSPLDSYLHHLAQLRGEGRHPHIVVVTGDLVDRPGEAAGEAALGWLDRLRGLLAEHPDLGPADPRIVLVGGNHDVSWDRCLDTDRTARHRWFAETFAAYPHPRLDVAAVADRPVALAYPGVGLRFLLLGSAESGGEVASDADRAALAAARDRWTAGDGADPGEQIRDFERIDPGVVARAVLDRLSAEEGYLTVAALHHPVLPVPTVEVAPYNGIVNAGQVVSALARADAALVLHGHTHVPFLASMRPLGGGRPWTLRVAGAATLAAADGEIGYNQISVGREGGGHALVLRPVPLIGGQWTPGTPVAFRPGTPAECTMSALVGDQPATG